MKNLTFKALVFAGAMILGLSAGAQNPAAPYVVYDANLLVPTNIDYVTLKTAGTVMGYYALPDPLYHPNYVSAGTLTGGFVWDWTVVAGVVAAKPGAANYVQLTYSSIGVKQITVAEHASAGMGGCVDGSPTVMNVTVINPPSAAIAGAAVDVDWSMTTLGHEYYRCGDLAAGEDITVTITETGAPAALASYAYSVKKVVENIDAFGVSTATVSTSFLSDYTTPAGSKYKTTTADGGTEVKSSAGLIVENSLRTKYTFTLQKATDLNASDVVIPQGIVSAISHKSDFISSGVPIIGATAANDKINTYGFTGTVTVVYIVNPTPVTGPIYHIANTFAY